MILGFLRFCYVAILFSGGDYRSLRAGDLLRWTAHCAFGSILRFHGNNHRPWSYGPVVESTIRQYITTRYKLAPSLIAAGEHATRTGFPFVTRCDLVWPEYPAAQSNNQYLFLNDTLVAPIFDTLRNLTGDPVSVWIPPGTWVDAWTGEAVMGPRHITASQPFERIPLWHKQDGAMTILTDKPGMRIAQQDWSSLTLDVRLPATVAEARTAVGEEGSVLTAVEEDTTLKTRGEMLVLAERALHYPAKFQDEDFGGCPSP